MKVLSLRKQINLDEQNQSVEHNQTPFGHIQTLADGAAMGVWNFERQDGYDLHRDPKAAGERPRHPSLQRIR